MRRGLSLICLLGCLCLLLACDNGQEPPGQSPKAEARTARKNVTLTFSGGPMGGTFNYFANKMASLIAGEHPWLNILTRNSGGSVDNLNALEESRADMAIVYAGDAYLGRRGRLEGDPLRHDQICALAFLYGAPAQLVVRKDLGIRSVLDLKGRTIAVGNPGSGAAISAERFFRHLNLWGAIDHRAVGYSQAAADLVTGKVDGFWVLVGYPNAAIIEAASHVEVVLIDLHRAALVSDFYGLYPFYTKTVIPAGTYEGQTDPVETFQDSALWCARSGLADQAVAASLESIFTKQGLDQLRRTHKAARSMTLEGGLSNLSIPLHPAAVRFWTDQKVAIPATLQP